MAEKQEDSLVTLHYPAGLQSLTIRDYFTKTKNNITWKTGNLVQHYINTK